MSEPIPKEVVLDTNAVSAPLLRVLLGRVGVVIPTLVLAEHARQGYVASLRRRGLQPPAPPYDPAEVDAFMKSLTENHGCRFYPFGINEVHAFARHFGERFFHDDSWKQSGLQGKIDAGVLAAAVALDLPLVSDDGAFDYLAGERLAAGFLRRYRTDGIRGLVEQSSPPGSLAPSAESG